MKRLNSVLILLIGNELLNGSTKDKNAALLLEKLSFINGLYIEVAILPDIKEKICDKITAAIPSFDLIVTSGGLGPTTDDLTIESIAQSLTQKLVQNLDSLNRLEEKFKSRGRELKPNNLKQTFFPESAKILINNYGTADASISLSDSGTYIATFPGVPREFQLLIENNFIEWLNQTFKISYNKSILHFRIFGLSESHVGSVIESLNLSPEIIVAYRPQFPEILVSLKSDAHSLDELKKVKERIVNSIGSDFIISNNEKETLPHVVFDLLKQTHKTVSFAESCTGGRLSSELTKISGSSEIFLGSVICYSNSSKKDLLNVNESVLENKGAVSSEVASELAENIRKLTGSSISISITGVAGPEGGNEIKPVGLVYLGLSKSSGTEVFKFNLPWDRERNQIYTTWLAFDFIRRSTQNLNLNWEAK